MMLPNKNWHLPSASTRTKSLVTAAADLQQPPLKEFRVKFSNEASVYWEKPADRSSDRYFQKVILWVQLLHLLICRKTLKSLRMASVHYKQQALAKMCAWLHGLPYLKLYITLTSPRTSSEQLSELSEMLSSRQLVLILPQIKLAHNSHLLHSLSISSVKWDW